MPIVGIVGPAVARLKRNMPFPAGWNASRCLGDELTVAMRLAKGSMNAERFTHFTRGNRPAEIRQVWVPPTDMGVRVIDKGAKPGSRLQETEVNEACLVVVVLGEQKLEFKRKDPYDVTADRSALSRVKMYISRTWNQGAIDRTWAGGANMVVVDNSDAPINATQRAAHLGRALIARSHAEEGEHQEGFDISLPLYWAPPAVTGRKGMLPSDLAPLQAVPALSRRYLMTYKGSLYMDHAEGTQRRQLLHMQLNTSAAGVAVYQRCFQRVGCLGWQCRQWQRPFNLRQCEELERRFNDAPSYSSLLNTTFALVPSGRSPASWRLNEVMAVGAIPVFLSGDVASAARYVPPFAETVPWEDISLHFRWDDHRPFWPVKLNSYDTRVNAGLTRRILAALEALSPQQIARMQAGVRRAWRQHLEPQAARRTFWRLLKRRVAGAREALATQQRRTA